MIVTTDQEMWIVETPDGPVLCTPTVTNARSGKGMPGLMSPRPIVLPKGTAIEVAL